MRRAGLLLVPALAACSGQGVDSGAEPWLAVEKSLGEPLAQAGDFDPSDGQRAWTAAEQLVPGLTWGAPGVEIPLYLWEDVALSDDVSDDGSCPYVNLSNNGDGSSTRSWLSDCRSTDGYEWVGSVTETTWLEDDLTGVSWTQWTFDLSIVADNDDPDFDELHLQGVVWSGAGTGERLVRSVQVNVEAGIDGYWERTSGAEDRETAWNDLALTGRWEHTTGQGADRHRMAGTAVMGAWGGLDFDGPDLREASDCPGEPDGELDLVGARGATLSFDGSAACDRCAGVTVDGSDAGTACPG